MLHLCVCVCVCVHIHKYIYTVYILHHAVHCPYKLSDGYHILLRLACQKQARHAHKLRVLPAWSYALRHADAMEVDLLCVYIYIY